MWTPTLNGHYACYLDAHTKRGQTRRALYEHYMDTHPKHGQKKPGKQPLTNLTL